MRIILAKGQLDHSYTFWTMANYSTVDCLCFFDSDVTFNFSDEFNLEYIFGHFQGLLGSIGMIMKIWRIQALLLKCSLLGLEKAVVKENRNIGGVF